MDGVYNPVSRTGYQARFRNTILADSIPISTKHRLPEFCRDFSASELIKVLKCPVFSSAFPAANDDELASLAESLMTSPPVPVQLNTRIQVDQIMQGAKELHLDELSGLSGNSFDSKTSQNAFYIEQRAKYKVKDTSMRKLRDLAFEKDLSETETNLIMELGQFNREEFQEAFPQAAERIWNVSLVTRTNKEVNMEDLEEQDLSFDDEDSIHSSEHSDSTEVAGSPSKGTGGLNPGGNN
jgi:glutamyl/glutaminyl-tRNA synthetase